MKKKIIILFLCLFLLSSCKKMERWSGICYDCGFSTVWNWILYDETEKEYQEKVDFIKERSRYYHRLFDIYHNYEGLNNIKTINDNAGIKEVEVDPAIIELLQLSQRISELSNGSFDITYGHLFRLWHNAREEGKTMNELGQFGKLPEEETLMDAKQYHGFEHIIINEEKSTVFIDDPMISLDVGGIAKGFAVEKIAQELEELGLKHGSVVGGGNVRTIHEKGNGEPWGVAINDPRNNENYSSEGIINVFLSDSYSVVTSGTYFNYYLSEDGKKMHHIINPKTAYPSNLYDSITILTKDSGLADALSTSLFNMTIQEGLSFIEVIKEEFQTEVEVLWIANEKEEGIDYQEIKGLNTYMTSGFEQYTKK